MGCMGRGAARWFVAVDVEMVAAIVRRLGLARRRGAMRRLVGGGGCGGCGGCLGRDGQRRMLAGSGALSRTLLWLSVVDLREDGSPARRGGEKRVGGGVCYAMVGVRRTKRLAGGIVLEVNAGDARPWHAARDCCAVTRCRGCLMATLGARARLYLRQTGLVTLRCTNSSNTAGGDDGLGLGSG